MTTLILVAGASLVFLVLWSIFPRAGQITEQERRQYRDRFGKWPDW